MFKTFGLVVVGLLVVGVGHASAQLPNWDDRAFININGGGGSNSLTVSKHFEFVIYQENATIDLQRSIKGGGFFDITGGYKIGTNWGVGASFMRRGANSDGSMTGSIPDRVLFDRPRAVSGTVGGLKYSESIFAPLFVFAVPMTDKIDVFALLGPAVGRVSHELMTDFTLTEGASGPEITVARQTINKSFWGFHGGVDVRYLLGIKPIAFVKQIGVGGFLRYNGARGNLTPDVRAKIGGFQGGGGLRVRF